MDVSRICRLPRWMTASAAVCLLGLSIRVGSGRWRAFTGVRHFCSYPPAWLAGWIGAALILIALPWLPEVRDALHLGGVAVTTLRAAGEWMAAGAAAAAARSLWLVRRSTELNRDDDDAPPLPGWNIQLGSFEEIKSWATDDNPVKRASDDAFGHARIAGRIASRLAQPSPSAQAVIGRLGSGKTTLRNLVEDALTRYPRGKFVRLVSAELWPYETPRAAVAGIIGTLIEALSKEVNVISLRGVPGAYAEAMAAAGGIWSALVRLQGVPSDPFVSLGIIDRVATTLGLRFVVWIEDLERFAGGAMSDPDESRLSPIRALLYGLDQLDSVTVITATTTLHARFDIEKIARFVEYLPELPEPQTRTLLAKFRQGLLRGDYFDPAARSAREKLAGLSGDLDMKMVRALAGPGVRNATEALIALCRTPRVLKQALRSCLDTWGRLVGEIDPDDVLVLSVLRESQPNAFALIPDHLHFLRSEERSREPEAAWQSALASLKIDETTRTAIEYLVEFAFDKDPLFKKPQGVVHDSHADYWERFSAVPRLGNDEKDQFILRRMRSQGDDTDGALLEMLGDSRYARAVEDFRNLVETAQLERLLVKMVERRMAERADQWPGREPPEFIPLWRMMNRRAEVGQLSGAVVWRELKRAYQLAVPMNLSLVAIMENHLATASSQVADLLREGTATFREEAKKYLRTLLAQTFAGNEAGLVRALEGAAAPILSWVTWGLDRVRSRKMDQTPFEEWSALADAIVRATRLSRKVMLPQVAALVVDETPTLTGSGIRYDVSLDRVAVLFGNQDTFRGLFAGETRGEWTEPHVVAVLDMMGGK
jgi:hypothetical protein